LRSTTYQILTIVFGILNVWLINALIVCFLYLIGHPPVMTLSPLIPSVWTRAYRRELRGRPDLDDDEFYALYYAKSDVPPDVVAQVRDCVAEFDPLAKRAAPSDNLQLLEDELDLADLLHAVGTEFGVKFTRRDYPLVDGTLDNLIRLVTDRLPVPGLWHKPHCGYDADKPASG
jgi:hypothetical protein